MLPPSAAGWRRRLAAWIESPPIQHTLITLILINAVILGLETSAAIMQRWGEGLRVADQIILGVFVVEIVLRIAAHGTRFFREPWSVFDFVVVAIALVPAGGPLAVLRALRVLRVLRLVSMVPSMRRVVSGLLAALPGLGSVFAIILLIFYVGAVIATRLFGAAFPDWFGTLGASAYTLFQVMTLESWSMGIVRPVMGVHPYAWVFFVTFILVSTFTMLNLFIAVIVNAIQGEHEAEARRTEAVVTERIDEDTATITRELAAMRLELAALRRALAERDD